MIADIAADVGRGLKGELMLSTARNQYLLGRITKTLARVVAAQKAAGLRGQFRPAWAKVRFGENCPLPPLRVRTPAGQDVLLSGLIDRVDLIGGGADAAVVDYRLSASALSLADVYWGVSLKLVTDLLALRDGGAKLAGNAGVAGGSLHPAAAFGVQMLRRIRDEHPDDALASTDERFHLRVKPRGVFDGRYAPARSILSSPPASGRTSWPSTSSRTAGSGTATSPTSPSRTSSPPCSGTPAAGSARSPAASSPATSASAPTASAGQRPAPGATTATSAGSSRPAGTPNSAR